MIDITTSRKLLLVAALAFWAGAAAAQEVSPNLFHPRRTAHGLRLSLFGEEDVPSPFAARFQRLTRLAGMFMGRVEAVTLCGMRVRLKLDLL